MRVFVVEMNNNQEYSDYEAWVEDVFESFRGASQFLLDKGFIPYAYPNWFESYISFSKVDGTKGWITEYKVKGD